MSTANKRLQELFQRWYDNQSTPEEREELAIMLSATDIDNTLTPLIKEAWERLEPEVLYTGGQIDAMTASILENSSAKVQAVHRVHFMKRWGWAAAIILIAGTITAAIMSSDRKPGSSGNAGLDALSAEIAPGRDRAILTLASGQQIILDSAQGDIVKQPGLTVINIAGKLKYEGAGTNAEYNTISTPKGGQYQIVLPDGSKVWLNAASSVKFPTAFTDNERKVEMTGEAYMEITKNPKQSFVVIANGAKIQVLGTSFNVNAYKNESGVRTTLVEGSVRTSANGQSVVLKPGEQSVIETEIKVAPANIEQTLAWKDGVFNFNGLNVKAVMRQLERWYDIDVQYHGAVSDDLIFEGKMYRTVSLSRVLRVLKTMGVETRLEGRILKIN